MSDPIRVTPLENNIDVAPDPHRMKKSETVRWESTNGVTFRIEFENESPFPERILTYQQATQERNPKPDVALDEEYKYSVIAETGVRKDPIIIIEGEVSRPGGG